MDGYQPMSVYFGWPWTMLTWIASVVIDDGAEALAFVRQQWQDTRNPPPDLAVLDFNLPKSDGLQILKAMREKIERSQAYRSRRPELWTVAT